MKKTHLPIIILLLAAALAAFPQTAKRNDSVRFSSVYTDLSRTCVEDATPKEKKEMENRGQDIPLVCKGFGGYRTHISYSAIEQYLYVENGERYEDHISIRPKDSRLLEQFGSRVEWRLANGKPFAVIVRFEHFSGDYRDGEGPFDPKYKTGESLIVQGLKNFERIYFELDAKTPNANQKARDLTDAAYEKNK